MLCALRPGGLQPSTLRKSCGQPMFNLAALVLLILLSLVDCSAVCEGLAACSQSEEEDHGLLQLRAAGPVRDSASPRAAPAKPAVASELVAAIATVAAQNVSAVKEDDGGAHAASQAPVGDAQGGSMPLKRITCVGRDVQDPWIGNPFDLYFSRPACQLLAAVLLGTWLMHRVAPCYLTRALVFSTCALLFAAPVVSSLSGVWLLQGPWNVFHEYAGMCSNEITWGPLGRAAFVVEAVLGMVLALIQLQVPVGRECATDCVPSPVFALVRMLLPVAMLWHMPAIWTHGFLVHGVAHLGVASGLVPAVLLAAVLLGYRSQLGCALLSTCFAASFNEPFMRHRHCGSFVIMLYILSFCPLDECYSLSTRFRSGVSRSAARAVFGGGVATGSISGSTSSTSSGNGASRGAADTTRVAEHKTNGESLAVEHWGRTLLRLHACFVYSCAGLDKLRWGWLGGAALQAILEQRSPWGALWALLLPSVDAQYAAAALGTWLCIGLELIMPFMIMSKKARPAVVALGFAMHLSMGIICGPVGGFGQLSFVLLLATLSDDDGAAVLLHDGRYFAIAILSVVLLMGFLEDVSQGRLLGHDWHMNFIKHH